MSQDMLDRVDPDAVHLKYAGDVTATCGWPLTQDTRSTTEPADLTCSACNVEYWKIRNEEAEQEMTAKKAEETNAAGGMTLQEREAAAAATGVAEATYVWSDVPVRATHEDTYNVAFPYGLIGGYYPWFHVVSDTGEQEDWKVVLREYDPDDGELLPKQYTITHEVVLRIMIHLAMGEGLEDLDDCAKYLGFVIDPVNWDTQFDVEDADRILQFATWGHKKYD